MWVGPLSSIRLNLQQIDSLGCEFATHWSEQQYNKSEVWEKSEMKNKKDNNKDENWRNLKNVKPEVSGILLVNTFENTRIFTELI